MSFYTPPGLMEVLTSTAIGLAIFNAVCLVITIIWWARADRRLLREQFVDLTPYSAADLRKTLARRREDYFYYQTLPLFVERSPLRIAMHRTSAPSLGPVLLVLLVQAIPGLSLFIGVWYTIHGGWHIGELVLAKLKERTPGPVKRLLFTTWF